MSSSCQQAASLISLLRPTHLNRMPRRRGGGGGPLTASPILMPVAWSVPLYAGWVVGGLATQTEPALCPVAFAASHEPTMRPVRAYAQAEPCDNGLPVMRAATGPHRLARDDYQYTTHGSLPRDETHNERLRRSVTSLPAVTRYLETLVASPPRPEAIDRTTFTGELVLAASSQVGIHESYPIRAAEALGPYEGAEQ